MKKIERTTENYQPIKEIFNHMYIGKVEIYFLYLWKNSLIAELVVKNFVLTFWNYARNLSMNMRFL